MRPSITAPCLLALILSAALSPARADDGTDLMKKYTAFMGWTLGDGSVESIRIRGKIADQSSFDEICEPNRFAQYNVGLQSGRSFLVEGSVGSAWVSHAGQPKDLPNAVGQDLFTQYLLVCNSFAEYPATVIGTVAPGGTNSSTGYALVALSIPREPTVILSINKDTGQITSVDVDGVASYEAADLKAIDDKRKIYTRWKRMTSDATSADIVISAAQINPSVDPAIFERTALDSPPPMDPSGLVTFPI